MVDALGGQTTEQKAKADMEALRRDFDNLRRDMQSLTENLRSTAESRARNMAHQAEDIGRQKLHQLEAEVEARPLPAVGIAFGVGFVLGWLMR